MRLAVVFSMPILWALLAVDTSQPRAVTFAAADGVTVRADFYPARAPKSRGVLLMFHQAGGNRAEYANVAPRLAREGWSALAVDLRVGGREFGADNLTARACCTSTSHEAALADLEAALRWARARFPRAQVLLVGSSFSASLAFVLAARFPREVGAVLAFSPADAYLETTGRALAAARRVRVPVFVASTREEAYLARPLFEAVPARDKTFFVPRLLGLHGAQALAVPLSPHDYWRSGPREYWAATETFLAQFK